MRLISTGCGAVLACLVAASAGAQADDDAMAVQRCIWSCLSAFGPADSPEYQQCVADHCAESAAPDPAPARGPSTTWTTGTIDGGRTAYAGVDTADGARGLYYFCDRSGRSDLMLAGFSGTDVWALVVNAETHTFRFSPGPNGLYAPVPPDNAVFGVLRRFDEVSVEGTPGRTVMGLSGSGRALSAAMARCR
ncbi:hypothetical protein ROJ8625_01763 [Roseivivax jejudonensis]|uniref:Uncharacterized protein n=1 Tax=Roseivivax jejudonensis TaxID=1529041 RepID=A0A1X6Z2A3_9RHOB|nr:hypothetical protein [Roseivivax jejudonensis]SLN38397.1 hypothetical protein ROJ8625_01763 [Roseivivax jejudonensis]